VCVARAVNQTLATQFVECSEQKDIAYIKIEIDQDTFVKKGEGKSDAGDGLEQIFEKARVIIVKLQIMFCLLLIWVLDRELAWPNPPLTSWSKSSPKSG